ncbi:MAG TPA: hypothetical protein VEA99_11220 [Gemmatimonadaceae bacterium]|nr:hypothetical protein [Gemmatimonadaceae bacterium]
MSPTALPPYAIIAPAFRFRALAALAGRAALGGPRELALACVIGARLAHALVPQRLSVDDAARAARAAGARAWLASAALPPATRVAMARLYDATGRPVAPASASTPAPRSARVLRASGAVRAHAATSDEAGPGDSRGEVTAAVAAALRAVVEVASSWLDASARQELLRLASELAPETAASRARAEAP